MVKLAFFLIALNFFSALATITSQYQVRKLFMLAEKEERLTLELENQFRRLQAEQTAAARHVHTSEVAKAQLGLVPVSPRQTIYLKKNNDSLIVMSPAKRESP